MIPILFPSTETAFTTQGLGRLLDARRCEVTEERNGAYELVLEYPVSGPHYSELVPGNYIYATHDDNGDMQAFEIYQTSAPLDGWMTVNAWHISYALNSIVAKPFTASSCSAALSALVSNSMTTNPFTISTDKTTSGVFSLTRPMAIREALGGTEGSILDVYGSGEYEFDMFNVILHAQRGEDRGVTIRYGKNLTKLDYTLNAANQFNAVVPYWQNEDSVVYVNHVVVRTGDTADRVIALDLSNEFEQEPTAAQLESAAQNYIDASQNYTIKDNIKLDFVQIWQTEEYKFLQDAEKVKLCDTVTIVYDKFGISATAKVIKVVYDTLLDRYISVELGEPQTTLSQQIAKDVSGSILSEVPSVVQKMTQSFLSATHFLSGSAQTVITRHVPSGSRHLVILTAVNAGYQAELLVTASSTGAMFVSPVYVESNLTVTSSTNTLTITKSSGVAIRVTDYTISGEAMS